MRTIEDEIKGVLTEELRGVPHLGPVSTALVSAISRVSAGEEQKDIRLIRRDGALDHVEKIAEADDPRHGIWLADVTAEQIGAAPGDRIVISGPARKKSTRVAGLYRYLPLDEPRPYWQGFGELIYRGTSDDTYPASFAIVPSDEYYKLTAGLGDFPDIRWEAPLEMPDPAMSEVVALVDALDRVAATVTASVERGELKVDRYSFEIGTLLELVRSTATERIESVTPVVDLLAVAGGLVALGVMAAAGFYLVRRRIVEARSLSARGIGPLAQGLRYGLEATIPAGIGTAAGVFLGFAVVRLVGPTNDLPLEAATSELPRVVLMAVIGLVTMAAGAAFAVRRAEKEIAEEGDTATERRALVVAMGFAVAGVAVAVILRNHLSDVEDIGLRDPMTMALPIGLILCASVVGAMALRLLLPQAGRLLRDRSPSLYLASRRLAGAPGMTQVLVTAGACALGVMLYGITVGSSVKVSTQAKAKLFVGSDFAAQTSSAQQPQGLSFPSTLVSAADGISAGDGFQQVTLVGVDPATFDGAAYWDSTFADVSLEELLGELSADGDPVPAASVGEPLSGPLNGGGTQVPLRVVETLDAFPGVSEDENAVVVTIDNFHEILKVIGSSISPPDQELWASGDPEMIERSLLENDVTLLRTVDTGVVLDTPGLQSMLWTLGVLGALGAAAGLIAMLGLFLYLQARHRDTVIASAITRRMGFSRTAEFTTSLAEILGAALISLGVATAAGLPVAALMHVQLDLRPTLPPDPLLVIPMMTIAATVAIVGVASAISAWRVQRSIDRADIAQVMRT
ncbi:MAG: hypothetical protein GEU71_15035 [Actinobacteria bacterium]|nr:hypothetical protein [Actinomycetota bacterium]